jgi:hypothetical protein
LHGAEDAQGIFREGGAGVAKETGAEIGFAAVRVDKFLSEGIPGDGVEGEIAAGQGIGVVKIGVGCDGEAAMAGAGFGLTAGEGDVVFGTRGETEFYDAETAPNHVGGSKGSEDAVELFKRGASDFDIHVLGFGAEEPIADRPADDKGASDLAEREQDGVKFFGQAHRAVG